MVIQSDDQRPVKRMRERGRISLQSWPSPQDYNEAIQTPAVSFYDSTLRSGTPETTDLGFPRPSTGMFASVYRIHCLDRDWAVRCFLHNIPDQAWRYAQLEDKLRHTGLPYFLEFEFQRNGINSQENVFPIVKMEWCDGEPLDRWIHRNLHSPESLNELAHKWALMIQDLQNHCVAHGDLQHGNVLVSNGELKLVDYDGMYVPALAEMGTNELGHPNYQHPGRNSSHFGPYLDHFSAWLTYGVLQCLQHDPGLWSLLRCGEERLFFTERDYRNPSESRSFRIIEEHQSEEIRGVGRLLRYLLSLPVESVPPLGALDLSSDVLQMLPPLNVDSTCDLSHVFDDCDAHYEEPLNAASSASEPSFAGASESYDQSLISPIFTRSSGQTALRLANVTPAQSEIGWIAIFVCAIVLPAIFVVISSFFHPY